MLNDDKLHGMAQAAHTAYFITDGTNREEPFNAAQAAAMRSGADQDRADLLAFVLDWYTLTINTPISVALLIHEFRRVEHTNTADPEAWRATLMASEYSDTPNAGN